MVNDSLQLDLVFRSLADPIRRDILRTVLHVDMTAGQLAERYDVSFPAISKHLKVLEKARLIRKVKKGRLQIVSSVPETLQEADEYLEQYRRMWQSRHDKLQELLRKGE
jgi:DNA-binding transcriptional ArsR family regulator